MTLAVGDRTHLHNIWSRNIFPFSMENSVLFLPLWQEDVQGSTLQSYDPYHHVGTVTGATYGSQGRTFDGLDDHIVIPAASSLNMGSQGTVMVWIKPTTVAANDIFCGRYNTTAGWFFRSANLAAAKMEFSPEGVTSITGTADVLVAGAWSHVTATYDTSGVVRLYHNAILDKTSAAGQPAITEVDDLWIAGVQVAALYFPGVIGEVLLYNRALTAAEILNHYLATKWRY